MEYAKLYKMGAKACCIAFAMLFSLQTHAQQDSFATFNDWMERYRGAPSSEKIMLLEEGILLAQLRHRALLELIPVDPQLALAYALSYADIKNMPDALRPYTEKIISGEGTYRVNIICGMGLGEGHSDEIHRFVSIGSNKYEAFTYGRRLGVTSKHSMSMYGIAVENRLALYENPVRVIPDEERSARNLKKERVAIEVNGTVEYVDTEADAEAMNQKLIQDEGALGPSSAQDAAPASTWTEGTKKLLYIMVDYPDLEGQPETITTVSNAMIDVARYLWKNSYGKLIVQTTYAPGTYRMSENSDYYQYHFDQLMNEATDAAADHGYDSDNYDLYIVFSEGNFSYAGRASVGEAGCHLVDPYYTLRTAGHELGHNLGLWHANYWRTDSDFPVGRDSFSPGYVGDYSNAEWIEYGHRFSLMSAQSTIDMENGNAHYAAQEKYELNWLTSSSITKPASGITWISLYPQDDIYSTNNPRVANVNVAATDYTGYKRQYWLSYRTAYTNNDFLNYGIQIDWGQSSYGEDGAILLDMTPFSNDENMYSGCGNSCFAYLHDGEDKWDSSLLIGRTYSDTSAKIHITPGGYGGTGVNRRISVVIAAGDFPANDAPSLSIAASTNSVGIGEDITFTTVASDVDGDVLYYYWDFGDRPLRTNNLNSSTATMSWIVPGEYVVRCEASDGMGGKASDDVVIRVGNPINDLRISGRVVSGDDGVEGVRVYFSTNSSYTTSDGSFTFAGLSSGSYAVKAQKYGHTYTAAFSNPVSVISASVSNLLFYEQGSEGILILQPPGGVELLEGGVTNTYNFMLTSPPATNVTVTFNYSSQQLRVTPSSIVVMPSTWQNAQTVHVAALSDGLSEPNPHTSYVSHVVTSLDASYNGLAVSNAAMLISADAENVPPILNEIGDQTVTESNELTFAVSAIITESELVLLSASNLPGGSTFMTTNENATFTWPVPGPAGIYTMTFYAVDNDGSDSETISITVKPTPRTLVHYDFEDSATNFINTADVVDGLLSASSFTGSDGAWSSGGGNPGKAISDTNWTNNNKYWSFTITVDSGYVMDLTSIRFDDRSLGGPTNWTLRSSLDNFMADIAAGKTHQLNYSTNKPSVSLNGITGNVEFRLYGFNAFTTLGTWRIDNMMLIGYVQPYIGNDADADGLPDDWEIRYFGNTSMTDADNDNDNDGSNNESEYVAGTVPTNGASIFEIDGVSNQTDATVFFLSQTGRVYDVDRLSDLISASWNSLQTNIPGTGGTISIADTNAIPNSIYRVRVKIK